MGMHLPGLYEQLKTLDYLMRDGEQSGKTLREKVNVDLRSETEFRQELTRLKLGWLLTLSAPAFYQMMAHLEKADEVEGWYKDLIIDEVELKERWYRIKEGGERKVNEAHLESLVPDYRVGWVFS